MLHQLSIIPIVASTCKGIGLRTGCVSKLYDHLNLHLLYCISCSRLKRNSLLLTFFQTFNVKWMKLSFSFSKPIRIAQIVVWDNCPAEKCRCWQSDALQMVLKAGSKSGGTAFVISLILRRSTSLVEMKPQTESHRVSIVLYRWL